MADLSPPPLLRLPCELRDIIYAEVFKDCRIKIAPCGASPSSIGILRANRQMYDETIDVYYRSVTPESECKHGILPWAKGLPSKRLHQIQHVALVRRLKEGFNSWL